MIQINLVPDVKQELIRAERVRSIVITLTIFIGIAAVGLVVLLSIWVFGVQTTRSLLTDNTIKKESTKLAAVRDLPSTLTIQNQLEVLPDINKDRHVDSRIFDLLVAINPSEPNSVSTSKVVIDSANRKIFIEAQAMGGYPALEVFKKTIVATKFMFVKDGEEGSVPIASNVSDGERSYGRDDNNNQVLRFELSFTYPEELFMTYLDDTRVIGPARTNVTGSYVGIPKSLFAPKASDTEEEG